MPALQTRCARGSGPRPWTYGRRSGDLHPRVMEYREPPGLAGKRLDLSEFHPLDHRVWERRCREFPGSRRRHLKLRWTFFTEPALR